MMRIERRNVVRQAMLADGRSPEGKEAWRRALRALVHEQQQLHTNVSGASSSSAQTATDVMRALVSGSLRMAVVGCDEDEAAQMVVGLLQLEW